MINLYEKLNNLINYNFQSIKFRKFISGDTKLLDFMNITMSINERLRKIMNPSFIVFH